MPQTVATASAAKPALVLPGCLRSARLDNGLELRVLERPSTGIVSTVLWYRAGCRDETPGKGGLAHFLEHMMFRGSAGYPAGEIDRLTVEHGGDNNAYTCHDATVYYFRFAADQWSQALAFEADRMAGLSFEPKHLLRERQVVLEEISSYENEPWEMLEAAVVARFYSGHSYGRQILGARAEVGALVAEDVHGFHRQFYGPESALLTVAGEATLDQVLRAAEPFAALEAHRPPARQLSAPHPPARFERLELRRGDVDRMLLLLPAWPAADPRQALLRLLVSVLTHGRQSRLHRRLVEERQLCAWISAEVAELELGGHWSIALEVLPGVEPKRVEEAVLGELAGLESEPPTVDEIARSQKQLVVDWLFGHERVHDQAIAIASEEAYLGRGWSARTIAQIADTTPAQIAELVTELGVVGPEGGGGSMPDGHGVLGWSLAEHAD